eukprot:scaffold1727_cov150-Amphora_coffeaeformis.AAC.3
MKVNSLLLQVALLDLVSASLTREDVHRELRYKSTMSKGGSKGNSPKGRPKGSKKELSLEEPYVAAVCGFTYPDPAQFKIPPDVILKAKADFVKEGGAVLYGPGFGRNKEQIDIVNEIQSLEWEPFNTPPEGDRTPPEPYAFRTGLPFVSSGDCSINNLPHVVFIPKTHEQAAEAIKIVNKYKEQFAIMSGGHDYECQSTSNTALILTSGLDKVEVDIDSEVPTVTTGAGVLWYTVNEAVAEANPKYGAMSAQCPTVSVSGYIMGGGFSWEMAAIFGNSLPETVLEAVIVLADGKIVHATRDNKYSDLLWAVTGTGGSQVALVVEWKFKLFESPDGGFTRTTVEFDLDGLSAEEGKEFATDLVLAANYLIADSDIGGIDLDWRDRGDGRYTGNLEIPCAVQEACGDCRPDERFPVVGLVSKWETTSETGREYYENLSDWFLNGRPYFLARYGIEAGSTWGSTPFSMWGIQGVVSSDPMASSFTRGVDKATWHFQSRPGERPNGDDRAGIIAQSCIVRDWDYLVENTLGENYHGPYWNYLDAAAEKLKALPSKMLTWPASEDARKGIKELRTTKQ